MTITTHRRHLEARCCERGYDLADVMPCVVSQNADVWTIDVDHEDYPRPRSNEDYTRPKKNEGQNPPNLITRLTSWQRATQRWIDAGSPVRSEDEVQRILRICQSCPFYNKRKKRCQVCGCNVNGGKFAILNKIRMATENCPKHKW
jgi:hypothetical protein